MKKTEPNQAVEPTIIHVTDRADARSAPCMIAAHFGSWAKIIQNADSRLSVLHASAFTLFE